MKKSTLFVVVLLLAGGCIEPDDFGPEGTYTAETRATVKVAKSSSLSTTAVSVAELLTDYAVYARPIRKLTGE